MNIKLYSDYLINRINLLKDRHRDEFTADEINTLNKVANLIQHNKDKLTRE